MGAITSRRNAGVEEIDFSTSNAYRYPPKSGCYFGSYFIMGGERFDTTQPENYLFGENQDLNFLGNRPVPFPYPAPQANEPTKTLKSLVNIRKDSLRFVKVVDDEDDGKDHVSKKSGDAEQEGEEPNLRYNIEFTFDSDVRVAITVYYFATEEISNGQAIYHPKDPTMNSETFRYKSGANQTFSQSTHIIEPSKFPEEEWQYNPDKEFLPIVIQCIVEDDVEHIGHSHMTFGTVERASDGHFTLKPLKQKQMVDGLCYLLQEIYGIENKNNEKKDDELDDSGSECVICMCDVRDTLILPCRHLCLCNGCAYSLRYQANNCPICRAPFRALLQIRAMRKKLPTGGILQHSDPEEVSQECVPPGYEALSLIEALNGPNAVNQAPNPPSTPNESASPYTSPDGTPLTAKKNSSKRSSAASRSSSVQGTVTQDGNDPAIEIPGTPEFVMSSQCPDPSKPGGGDQAAHSSPPPEGSVAECVEIVDEIGNKSKTVSTEPSAAGEGNTQATSLSGYQDPERDPVDNDVVQKDTVDEAEVLERVDPDSNVSLLPSGGSDSTYSSTSSNKGLLKKSSSKDNTRVEIA